MVDIHRNGYDMYPLLPKVAGKCDKCGDKLITRPDDEESVIINWFLGYQKQNGWIQWKNIPIIRHIP